MELAEREIMVGIIGFGTVGTGTARILVDNARLIKERLGFPVVIKRIADLDVRTKRPVKLPRGVLTTSAQKVLDDPDIDIIVELIGGISPARDFMLRAIRNGKHVVTANKALLATRGAEVFRAARRRGVSVGFEASVAGGIPIIKVMREGLVANRVNAIYGIINGTSNYILTRMTEEGAGFEETLKEAQRLGYAEADPAFDVGGVDAAHKLTLLGSLAYGIPLSFKKIFTEGIDGITPLDIEFASELGYKIKPLAIAKATDGEVELRVHPTMVPKEHFISKVDGVMNAIYVHGDAVGETLYYGRGAGDMPTGSAVVSDICEIARNIVNGNAAAAALIQSKTAPAVRSMMDVESMYYFRFSALDRPGVLSRIAGIFGRNNISISSVIQKGRGAGDAVPLVILTHTARERDVLVAVRQIDRLNVVKGKTRFIRVEGSDEG